ncbi:WASH complex subunit 3-like isoform X1 [Orbicella faveolata]|uniref:WASH complex subunit 3-like isoform X1 n=1 Tax=Orbicella faveolata TaxID=48498 RepID=UPI0009E4616C|nr:WASH complex subunit 3-like isoform X1 [Orbicella faveolata]
MKYFFPLQKLADLSNKIQRIEIMMSILEAKLASIPGLEDVTVSMPAPSGAAAAPAAGSAPPPASDAPQPAVEAQGPPAPPAEEPEPEKPTMTVSKDPRYAKYFQMIKVVSFQKHSSQILLLIFQSSLRATSSCNDISSWLVEF